MARQRRANNLATLWQLLLVCLLQLSPAVGDTRQRTAAPLPEDDFPAPAGVHSESEGLEGEFSSLNEAIKPMESGATAGDRLRSLLSTGAPSGAAENVSPPQQQQQKQQRQQQEQQVQYCAGPFLHPLTEPAKVQQAVQEAALAAAAHAQMAAYLREYFAAGAPRRDRADEVHQEPPQPLDFSQPPALPQSRADQRRWEVGDEGSCTRGNASLAAGVAIKRHYLIVVPVGNDMEKIKL